MKKDVRPTDPQALSQKILGMLHFVGTLWFIVCVGYILAISLRQAGFNWWIIFSLSGQEEPLTVTGKIVRTTEDGVGIHFTTESEDLDKMIEAL